MKLKVLLVILISIVVKYSVAQQKTGTFLAIQPAITIEPFYEDGELDVNVLPVVVEWPIGSRTNLRILPTLNYHFGGSEQGLSDVGFYSVLPIFFRDQEEAKYPYGFYLGPVFGLGRNLINEHYTTTFAVEPGYFFETAKSFSISLGLQLGGSFFISDIEPNKWVLHWGPKVSFGFWLGKTSEGSHLLPQSMKKPRPQCERG